MSSRLDRLRRATRRFREVSLPERKEALCVLGTLLLAEAALRSLSFPRVMALFGVKGESSHATSGEGDVLPLRPEMAEHIQQTVRRVDRVVRVVRPEGSCLRRALVLGWCLRDLSPVLHIGVNRSEGILRAHAWLEVKGCALPELDRAVSPREFRTLRPLVSSSGG